MKKDIELLQGRARTITAYLDSLNINTDILVGYDKLGNEGLKFYEEWRTLMNDEKKFKELSPIEQQTLHENTRSYAQMLTALDTEVKYLSNTRHPLAVIDTLNHLLTSNQLLDVVIDSWGGTSGKFRYSKLKYVKEKGWEKVKYKDKVYNLATELDLLTEDYSALMNSVDPEDYDTTTIALLLHIYTSLVQARAWLYSEDERMDKEGMPEPNKEFKLPEIQVPKIPEDGKDQPKEDDKKSGK